MPTLALLGTLDGVLRDAYDGVGRLNRPGGAVAAAAGAARHMVAGGDGLPASDWGGRCSPVYS